MDNYHITQKGDKWALQKEGSDRALRTAETKAEIMVQMREYMSDKIGSVFSPSLMLTLRTPLKRIDLFQTFILIASVIKLITAPFYLSH